MENLIRFDEWMKKIKNIHYHDNEKMCNAFNKIKEDEKKESNEFIEKRIKDIEVEFEQIN